MTHVNNYRKLFGIHRDRKVKGHSFVGPYKYYEKIYAGFLHKTNLEKFASVTYVCEIRKISSSGSLH
jgi:hypothetical protein